MCFVAFFILRIEIDRCLCLHLSNYAIKQIFVHSRSIIGLLFTFDVAGYPTLNVAEIFIVNA